MPFQRGRGTLHSVLASLTVGGATLRRYGAVSYAKNSARDLRHGPIVAQVPVLQGDTFRPPTVNDASTQISAYLHGREQLSSSAGYNGRRDVPRSGPLPPEIGFVTNGAEKVRLGQ